MTLSYGGDPGASTLDEVRYLIGDTAVDQAATAFLTDEEINFRIASESTTIRAARRCAEDIVVKLARETDWNTGAQSKSKSQAYDHYRQVVLDLKRREAEYVAPSAGGLSVSEKAANEEEPDRVQGHFRRDQFRNRDRGQTRQGSGETFE